MITKSVLIEKVAERVDSSRREAKRFVDAMIEVLTEGLHKEGKAYIAGLGVFSVRKTKPRKVRTPDGKLVEVSARKRVVFKTAKALREKLNGEE